MLQLQVQNPIITCKIPNNYLNLYVYLLQILAARSKLPLDVNSCSVTPTA